MKDGEDGLAVVAATTQPIPMEIEIVPGVRVPVQGGMMAIAVNTAATLDQAFELIRELDRSAGGWEMVTIGPAKLAQQVRAMMGPPDGHAGAGTPWPEQWGGTPAEPPADPTGVDCPERYESPGEQG